MSQTKTDQIEFKPIASANIHGVWARQDNRAAEVYQCYEGQWSWSGTIDGQICKAMPGEPTYLPRGEAMKQARAFLRGEITPEVWPNCRREINGK